MQLTTTAQAGRNVRAEMARAGVSQADLAETLGLSQSSLSKRLRGVITFNINELATIASVLDVPLTDLIPKDETAAAS